MTEKQEKVIVWLKAAGDAPILKNKKWSVDKSCTIAKIMGNLKAKMDSSSPAAPSSVFIYVNQSFAPSPDQEVGTLHECFNIGGKLVLHYSISPAWG